MELSGPSLIIGTLLLGVLAGAAATYVSLQSAAVPEFLVTPPHTSALPLSGNCEPMDVDCLQGSKPSCVNGEWRCLPASPSNDRGDSNDCAEVQRRCSGGPAVDNETGAFCAAAAHGPCSRYVGT